MVRIVIDFLWLSILLSILLGLLASVIPAIGQSGAFVSSMVGALGAGMFYRRRTGIEATSAFAWKAAFVVTVVTLILSAVVVAWLRKSGSLSELDEISGGAYALGIVFVGIITLLVVRFFFRWGTRLGAKNA